MKKSLVILFIAFLAIADLSAKNKELPGIQPVNPNSQLMQRSENCFPPTAWDFMELNNVRFGMESGGLLWFDKTDALYEIPKGEGKMSMFAGGLWMGGRTPDQVLHLAAVTYRTNGTDFWNGPLSVDGNAEASNVLCQQFDKHYRANLEDVKKHILWFDLNECVASGECDESVLSEPPFENGYSIPDYFYQWPGNNLTPNYSYRLAPFGERAGSADEFYNPDDGDYPGYDVGGSVDCRSRGPQDPIPLFGDETLWWVFNDNAGIHTESVDGEPIGMEIQAQAFVYSTTDEINNMTFYNYVMINRGNQQLRDTYFGQYADADVGNSADDFVGCDVQRGLGYMYNGDEFDENVTGAIGYGSNPPAIGIDFFEGPYKDPDGVNNPIDTDPESWKEVDEGGQGAIPYAGIGLGYFNPADTLDGGETDTDIDNERFGMRRFVYYDRLREDPQTDPGNSVEFYNYLTGYWQNGAPFTYGGTGIGGTIQCDFVVPNDTDPVGFGVGGADVEPWSEETDGNTPGDRRFLQAAGPFTLDPGEFNNITVGVVWVQSGGGIDELRDALFVADDKAQALFDGCFRILNGPPPPGMTTQELDQEIILYLSDTEDAENYEERDEQIPGNDKFYRFEGYKIYQLVSNSISSADLGDPEKARLIYQCDVENGVGDLINYISTDAGVVPTEMVSNTTDDGIVHSFRVISDAFTSQPLINFKPYYFMAISYGYNEFEPYSTATQTGQGRPYLEGRLGNRTKTAIPHKTESEAVGTILSAEFGDLLPVTRIEGVGSGGNFLELTKESIDDIMDGPPWIADELSYEGGGSPLNVKVIDPLNVKEGDFQVRFFAVGDVDDNEVIDEETTRWEILDGNGNLLEKQPSNTIKVGEEFLLTDYGISIEVAQSYYQDQGKPKLVGSTMTFVDPTNQWLSGVPDVDVSTEQNWIRAGSANIDCDNPAVVTPMDPCYYNDNQSGILDPTSEYENVLGRTVSPWILAGYHWSGPVDDKDNNKPLTVNFKRLPNVDIVFTDDKSKWTRVPVLELQKFAANTQGGLGTKGYPRVALSVDKNGKNEFEGGNMDEITYYGQHVVSPAFIDVYMVDGNGSAGFSQSVLDGYKKILWGVDGVNHPNSDLYGHSFGYGWFPGYAIDVETGERLNMAFGENSYLVDENGDDMVWNPTSQMWNANIANPEFNPANARFGGMHYIYVFRNTARDKENNARLGSYDGANRLFKTLYGKPNTNRKFSMTSVTWCMLPLLSDGYELKSVEDGLIPSETTIKLRVDKPYERFPTIGKHFEDPYLTADGLFNYDDDETGLYTEPTMDALSVNDWFPMYKFTTKGSATVINDVTTAKDALDLINVVPNPYNAFSFYEEGKLDNRVKIINLPEECTIRIYNTAGTLVRTLKKDNPFTYIDWDMKNENFIPISGGAYIFHIEAPGVGAKIVKWFGVTRKLDLDNF